MRKPHVLVGKTVKDAFIAQDKQALRFVLSDGTEVLARCDGDCCSVTWVEHIENSDALLGGTVASVEDVDMPNAVDDHPEQHDQVAFYGCKITTDKGVALIDYRNDSNGYYGGSLEWSGGGDYYYGGVFGQNVSKEVWTPLVDC